MSERTSANGRTCPICDASVLPREENEFAPFCSRRCRNIDLGNWLGGTYRIRARVTERNIVASPEARFPVDDE